MGKSRSLEGGGLCYLVQTSLDANLSLQNNKERERPMGEHSANCLAFSGLHTFASDTMKLELCTQNRMGVLQGPGKHNFAGPPALAKKGFT